MCFSETADVVATVVVGAVAVPCLLSVRHRQEVVFALLPLLFAVHQFTEVFVWRALDGSASTQGTAAVLYVVYALPVLPVLLPGAVILLEPPEKRVRLLPFLGLGVVVAAYFTYALAAHGVVATALSRGIDYQVQLRAGDAWVVLYVVATVGPPLLSGYRSVVAFGAFNLAGLIAVVLLYYAAGLSALVLVHLRRRHRLLDAQGRPLPGHRPHPRPLPAA